MKSFKLALAALAIIIATVSCSKDQKVVRQLSKGTWEVTSMSVNGQPADQEDYASDEYTFEKCRVKKEDCAGVYTTNDPSKGPTSFDFTYSISDKGEKITINLFVFGFSESITYDIVEQSSDKFVWEYSENGQTIETTIEKK